jgi:hypothetical protein
MHQYQTFQRISKGGASQDNIAPYGLILLVVSDMLKAKAGAEAIANEVCKLLYFFMKNNNVSIGDDLTFKENTPNRE